MWEEGISAANIYLKCIRKESNNMKTLHIFIKICWDLYLLAIIVQVLWFTWWTNFFFLLISMVVCWLLSGIILFLFGSEERKVGMYLLFLFLLLHLRETLRCTRAYLPTDVERMCECLLVCYQCVNWKICISFLFIY